MPDFSTPKDTKKNNDENSAVNNGEDLISVIIPVYNAEAYLSECIESILSQTYRFLEIILIDDGSTDSSLDICNRYARVDDRIRVFHQENKGVSAARNTGMEHMTGELFMFADSDDILTQGAIELLLTDLSEYGADISSGGFGTLNTEGKVTRKDEDRSVTLYSGTDMLRLSLEGFDITSVCAKLFRSSIFADFRFCEGRNIHEDGFFLFQCFTIKPVFVQHNECVYLCRYHAGSNSRSDFSEKYLDMLYFCEQKKEIIRSRFPELDDKLVGMEIRTKLLLLDVLCRTLDKKYLNVQKDCIRFVKKHYREFVCSNRHLCQSAWITAHDLYPLYKIAVHFKYHR